MIDCLVLDAGPLITQSFTELESLAESFVTTPSVHNEIRDERARQNLMLWGDKLKLRQPKPQYVTTVTEFSKKTGDYPALSSTDLHILALCYEMECELNSGDWRLRKYPGQAVMNKDLGKPEETRPKRQDQGGEQDQEQAPVKEEQPEEPAEDDDGFTVVTKKKKKKAPEPEPSHIEIIEDFDEDDNEGWIGPEDDLDSAKTKAGDKFESGDEQAVKRLKAAMSSGDFAMQNVALQIGLNLVNPTNGKHIKRVRNYMLRCHACFHLAQLPKNGRPLQFCPKCGLNSLMRCTVSVNDSGKLQVHLKRNIQWITRGNKYSLPTPQSKNSRRQQRDHNVPLLREDQKEYQQAVKHDMWKKRHNEKMLDEWIGSGSADTVMSPFAISGYKRDATRHTGVRVGQGRHANAARKK